MLQIRFGLTFYEVCWVVKRRRSPPPALKYDPRKTFRDPFVQQILYLHR